MQVGTACAQSFIKGQSPTVSARVERALLDSAMLYEKMKPVLFHLKSAYEQQSAEVKELREALRLSKLQIELQKQNFTAAIAEERKKYKGRWWKGFRVGLGTGVAGGLLLGLKL